MILKLIEEKKIVVLQSREKNLDPGRILERERAREIVVQMKNNTLLISFAIIAIKK